MTQTSTHSRDLRNDAPRPPIQPVDDDGTTRTILDNGILVVARHLTTATAGIVIEFDTGSREDPEGLDGLHHFLEHMVFQGAGERGTDHMAEAFDDIAADMNAATTDSALRLEVSVMPRHMEEALALLADMALRPTFDAVRVENERSVILQEIADDDDETAVAQAAMSLAFCDDPVSRQVAGTTASVNAISRQDIVDQHAATFVGHRCTIALTGPVDREAAVAAVSTLFAAMPAGEPTPRRDHAVHRPGRKTMTAHGGRAMVRMTWPAPVMGASDESVVVAAMHILGNGPTSRLMRRLREADGLCYSTWAYPDMAPGYGMVMVGFETESRQGRKAVAAVLEEIRRLASDVTEVELTRAKRAIEMSLLKIVDRPLSMASLIAGKARMRDDEPSDMIESINAITLDDVRTYLRTMTPERCAAVTMGGGRTVLSDLPVQA